MNLAVCRNNNSPVLAPGAPVLPEHALDAAGVVLRNSLVELVLAVRSGSQVAPSVVESVAVDVVDVLRRLFTGHYLPSHAMDEKVCRANADSKIWLILATDFLRTCAASRLSRCGNQSRQMPSIWVVGQMSAQFACWRQFPETHRQVLSRRIAPATFGRKFCVRLGRDRRVHALNHAHAGKRCVVVKRRRAYLRADVTGARDARAMTDRERFGRCAPRRHFNA